MVFVATSAVCAWLAVTHLQRSREAGRSGPGHPLLLSTAHALDHRVTAGSLAYGVMALTLLVLFIIWTHQAATCVRLRRPDALRHAPGWAIGGWFVPIGNLWLPKQMVDDVWHGAVPPGKPRESAWLSHAWWATFLGGTVLRLIGSALNQGEHVKLDTLASGDALLAVAYAVLLVAALLGALLVVKTRGRFDRTAISPDELSPDPWPRRRWVKPGLGAGSLVVVIAAVAALTAPANGVDPVDGQQRDASVTPSPTAAPTRPQLVHSPHAAWSRLLAPTPAGWTRSGHDLSMSLQRTSEGFAKPAAIRRTLAALGYRRGVNREYYLTSPRKVADVELWQFATPAGANAFFVEWLQSNDAHRGVTWTRQFSLRAGHQGRALVARKADKYGFQFVVAAARVGDVIVHLRFSSLGAPSRRDVDTVMARAVRQLVRTAVNS